MAFANTGRGAIGDAAREDKNADASDKAAEAAGGRTGATGVTPATWAIAADASDKATEACWMAEPTVQEAGKVVTVTVTVSFWCQLRRGKRCSSAHHHEGIAHIYQQDVLRTRDELWLYVSKLIYHEDSTSHLGYWHEPRACQVWWSCCHLRTINVSVRCITSNTIYWINKNKCSIMIGTEKNGREYQAIPSTKEGTPRFRRHQQTDRRTLYNRSYTWAETPRRQRW